MFQVYIIYSKVLDQYYVGFSGNLDDRLFRHNNSGSKSTKRASDWTLVYEKNYATRSEAMKREKEIKGKKSRQYIERLVEKGT
jgi:putative endonuclease